MNITLETERTVTDILIVLSILATLRDKNLQADRFGVA